MQAMQALREQLTRKLPQILFVFCILQPILDMIGFWQVKLSVPNEFTLIIRMLMLVLTVSLGLLLSRRRGLFLLALGVMIAYLAAHTAAGVAYGDADSLEDLAEQVRILSLPLMTICFIAFFRCSREAFSAVKTAVVVNLGIILLSELLATLTGTDPHTYKDKGIGVLGWFSWANSQSAILSLAVPVAIAWAYSRKRRRLPVFLAVCLIGFGMEFFVATRLAYLTLAATGLGLAVCIVIADRAQWRYALSVLLCAAVFLALFPVSPMRKNRDLVNQNAAIKQERLSAAAAEFGVPPEARSTRNLQALAAVYRYDLQGMVDRFGLERTAESYGYSIDQAKVFDRRLKQVQFCRLLMQDAGAANRLFGLPIGAMRCETLLYDFHTDTWQPGTETFDAERDIISIYYECGLVGLLLLAGFLLWFLLRALLALFRSRAVFTVDYAAFCAAFAFAAVYAANTISVLRRNNASIYLALVLAGIWHLTRRDALEPSVPVADPHASLQG